LFPIKVLETLLTDCPKALGSGSGDLYVIRFSYYRPYRWH